MPELVKEAISDEEMAHEKRPAGGRENRADDRDWSVERIEQGFRDRPDIALAASNRRSSNI